VTRAGFPPVHLAEINFQSMYEQQQQQAAVAQQPASDMPKIITEA
jgi:preprotein translocase subunit SecB